MADTSRGHRLSGAGGSGSRTAIMRTACAGLRWWPHPLITGWTIYKKG